MPVVPVQPGCILEPEPAGMASIGPLLAAAELPEQYIVPSWRDCFTDGFEAIPEKVRPLILNQGQIDSCVGHATSVQKSAQEGVVISPRDIFRLAKRLDGYPLTSFGTTLSAAQDALKEPGAAEDLLVPRNPSMGRDAYLSLSDVTPAVENNRAKHKAEQPYFVPRHRIRETLISYGFPIVTSSAWYPEDNVIGMDGMMKLPTSPSWLGHAFTCIGWVLRTVGDKRLPCLVMVNSWGPDWGHHGLFFIPLDGTENRLSNSHISVDIEPSLAVILAQYNGRNVRVVGRPDHWKIEGGKRRMYSDELVWWAHGNLFGIDVYEISPQDIEVVPLGMPMTVEEAPFATRELVRQIRAYYGHT